MSSIEFLAVGGPAHGTQLRDYGATARIPAMAGPAKAVYATRPLKPKRWCVHPGEVVSLNDYDLHRVSIGRVAELNGMRRGEWHPAPEFGHVRDRSMCVFPSGAGRYGREYLPDRMEQEEWLHSTALSFTTHIYEKRIVADRAVYVYVGT